MRDVNNPQGHDPISKLIVRGKKKEKKDLIESDEVNGYAFQASFGELNKSKKIDGFFSLF